MNFFILPLVALLQAFVSKHVLLDKAEFQVHSTNLNDQNKHIYKFKLINTFNKLIKNIYLFSTPTFKYTRIPTNDNSNKFQVFCPIVNLYLDFIDIKNTNEAIEITVK
jgi:hypothetical protein